RSLERLTAGSWSGPGPFGGVQGMRRVAGAIRLRSLREISRDGSEHPRADVPAGASPRPGLLRRALLTGGLPRDACGPHGVLARRARSDDQGSTSPRRIAYRVSSTRSLIPSFSRMFAR